MLGSKLKYNRTETKNVKVAKMVEFIKTYDQYPYKFNFGNFFSSTILLPFCWGKIKKHYLGEMVNFFQPAVVMIRIWERFLLRDISKNEQIQLFDSQNAFSSNLNTMNLKLFRYHGPNVWQGSEYASKVGHMTTNKITFESFVGLECC